MIAYKLSKTTGFFSEFFFVCQAYLYSKHVGSQFGILDKDWLYQRWHDYFTSLHVVDHPDPFTFNQHTPVKFFTVNQYHAAVRSLFTLRAPLRLRIDKIVSSLPDDFIGLFVRRGDKLLFEAPFIPMADILSKISYTETTTFFVQTDDFRVIEEMKQLIPNKIVYTVPPTKLGSHHIHWMGKTPTQIREETEEMLVGLSVSLRSRQCWTDHTSNVGRFLKLYSPDTVFFYTTESVVEPERLIHPSFSLFE